MKTVIKQKEKYEKAVTLKYLGTNTPVDLTGCSAYCQMRTYPGGDLVATAECSVTPDLGRVVATFSSADTEIIEPGEYGFDIWLVSADTAKPICTKQVSVVRRYTENFEVE